MTPQPSASTWLTSLTTCCAPLTSCLVLSSSSFPSTRSKFSSASTTTVISWPLGRNSEQDLLIDQDEQPPIREKSTPPSFSQQRQQQQQQQQHYEPGVIRQQPRLYQHPPPERGYEEAYSRSNTQREKPPRKSSASSRTGLSLRHRFRSNTSTSYSSTTTTTTRRPLISAPSNFRHLRSGSFNFPATTITNTSFSHQLPYNPQARPNPPRRRHSLERLELSIYSPSNAISPLLPHFEFPPIPPLPQAAHLPPPRSESHERNYSSMSFHVPRKTSAASGSPSTTHGDIPPPLIPPKARGRNTRPRAYTSPEVDVITERVASAMIEVERLQRQIDDVIERQSLYAPSRPSTAHSMARTMPDLEEPMPSIPALPPSAPSFAQRLADPASPLTRPQTAPLRIPHRSKTFNEASAKFSTPVSTTSTASIPLPPPLPLVLRPPLRKKKSFSLVSNWLHSSNTAPHNRELSLESVTNQPRPVKGTEGFYQCVPAGGSGRRGSFGSVGSVATWDTEEDEEERTVPTSWSPGSTPVAKTGTFGRSGGITVQRSFGITAQA